MHVSKAIKFVQTAECECLCSNHLLLSTIFVCWLFWRCMWLKRCWQQVQVFLTCVSFHTARRSMKIYQCIRFNSMLNSKCDRCMSSCAFAFFWHKVNLYIRIRLIELFRTFVCDKWQHWACIMWLYLACDKCIFSKVIAHFNHENVEMNRFNVDKQNECFINWSL